MKNAKWFIRKYGGEWTEITAHSAESFINIEGEWAIQVRSWGMIFAQGCTEIQVRINS